MANQIFCFQNQEHALDGAIHGAIFTSLRDTRAFLLLNHLEIFSSISMEKFFDVYYLKQVIKCKFSIQEQGMFLLHVFAK